jgi:hypothetical protein
MSPRAPRHRVRHPAGEGSGVVTCLVAPGPPLCRKALVSQCDRVTSTTTQQGSGITTCPVVPDPPPGVGGLRSRHVGSGSRPPGVLMHSQDT